MATKGKQSAGSYFVHKLRQNWRWGKTRPWRHLLEEHDLNPLLRGQRALRKVWWFWARRDRQTAAAPVLLVGVQRSGTNMLAHGLQELPEFQVYNEGNPKAFEDYRLRPLAVIDALIEQSQANFVLMKPLCDSHRTPVLLDHFGPKARAIWAYRNVDDRVRSATAKFGDSNLRALRNFAAGGGLDHWQVQGLSPENADFIRSFDFTAMSAESAAALFWYVRNALYFDLGLDRRHDTILISYDELLAEPEKIARALCAFLDLDYRKEIIAQIDADRRPRKPPLPIDERIRERCVAMQQRLDTANQARMAKLAQIHAASPATSQRDALRPVSS